MPRALKSFPVARRLAPAPERLFAGTSGWSYPTWKPGFYPANVPSSAFLRYYASQMTSVEVNYTFQKLCTQYQLVDWLAATPSGFRFSFKAPQRITHSRRLNECAEALDEFLDSLKLAQNAAKLGVVLFQLPPNFKADTARLESFLAHPRLQSGEFKTAFEFRHASWFTEDTYRVLRQHNAALCVADTDDLITPDVQTAPHRYYRLRRDGGYKPRELKQFAECFTQQAAAGEVYAYLRHQEEPTGALNARSLIRCAVKLAPSMPAAEGPSA